ncbi:TonB-dependent siderophore receptor [Sulfuricella sp. T08]|uniref:TonB-dependent receptor plug domain-containing protein n=1 Tax=Sulfuricella sp. T08 TaxID=1632857 RepID=UPI000750739E|nr:TonB-dependent receptor [Sulfuricella sp. T08]
MRNSLFIFRFSSGCGLLGGTLLLSVGMVSAGENSAFSESAYLDEMPVVLSVSRLSQRVDEAPAAVTVIDRQMIKESGVWDLAEVFRLVPGMVVSYHSARGYSMDNTVSYHGLSDPYARSMQVLVDGRSVYSPLFGGVLWGDIPVALDDIERIEVIRGPNAASYGANSFMGVINIITLHPSETQGKFVSLTTGRNREEGVARYGGRNDAGDLTYRITAGVRNDKGEDPIIVNALSTQGGWDKNKFDDRKVQQFTLRGDYRVNATDELEFQFGYNGGDRQEGDAGTTHPFWKRADNHFEQLRWQRALEDGGELSVQYYHGYESSYGTDINGATSYNMDVIAQRHDLEVQHTFSPSRSTRVVWGGSMRYDNVYAPYYLRNSITKVPDAHAIPFHLGRLFGNLEWRAHPDLVFNLGAMLEENSFTGTDITPRVAANWHFLPGHTLRVSNSKATRTPTNYEKVLADPYLALGVVKQKLRPERVDSTEIGYLGKFSDLNVDFRIFRDEFSDLIVENGTSVGLGNLNPGNAAVKGFETQLQWNVGPRTRLVYGFSHSLVSSLNQAKITYTDAVPTSIQSMMLTHRFDHRWSTSLMGYKTGAVHFPETDTGPQENPLYYVNSYRRWDARLAYAFQAGTTRGELALVVQNLADNHYFEFRHDNEPPGRTAWLNLKLDL